MYKMCISRKYPYPPQGRLTEIPRGRGVSKAQFFKGNYDTKMEFPARWGVQVKKPSMGGVWIFSGTTQYTTQVWDVSRLKGPVFIFVIHANTPN